MTTTNLDQKSAHYAQEIIKGGLQTGTAKEVENLITKTLGVLQEQGVYAMMLFLFSRTSKEEKIAPFVREQLYQLLVIVPPFTSINSRPSAQKTIETLTITNDQQRKKKFKECQVAEAEVALPFFSNTVCDNLDTLLLVKDLYEQTLIYARYGAKAASKEEKGA